MTNDCKKKMFYAELARYIGTKLNQVFKIKHMQHNEYLITDKGIFYRIIKEGEEKEKFKRSYITIEDLMGEADDGCIETVWSISYGDVFYYIDTNNSVVGLNFDSENPKHMDLFEQGNFFQSMTKAQDKRNDMVQRLQRVKNSVLLEGYNKPCLM